MQHGVSADFTDLLASNFGGADVARFPIDPDSQSGMDAYLATLAAGVTPILAGAGWGSGPPTPKLYGAMMARMAKKFPKAIYQLWNEPNMGSGSQGGAARAGGMSASDAARFAVAGAKGIRKVRPGARIIGPSVAPVGNWQTYFKQLYRKVPKGLMDVGLNLYPGGTNRLGKVKDAFNMAREFGPVDVTELDMAAPWMGGGAGPKDTNANARQLLRKLGARMVVMNATAMAGGGVAKRGKGQAQPPEPNDPITATGSRHRSGRPRTGRRSCRTSGRAPPRADQDAGDPSAADAPRKPSCGPRSSTRRSSTPSASHPAAPDLVRGERADEIGMWDTMIGYITEQKEMLPKAIRQTRRYPKLQKPLKALLAPISTTRSPAGCPRCCGRSRARTR